MQEHQKRGRGALSRPAFQRIAAEEHCQLYFPVHGEQVVLLRSGLQVHLKRYMQSLGLAPLDDPTPAARETSPSAQEDQPSKEGTPAQDAPGKGAALGCSHHCPFP